MTEWEVEFAKRLKALREEREPFLSQSALGEALGGIKQKVVSKWEVGDDKPTYEHLLLIAKFYNVTTDYLLGVTKERQEKVRDPSDEELRQRLFEFITPDRAPEILERITAILKSKN